MSHTLQELEDLIPADPLNDSLRVELEQLLASSEPNEIEHELLYRERMIAESLDRGQSIDEQIHEYKQFRIAQSNYFWDMRGNVDHLFRPFSLWLVHCLPNREFALNVAMNNKINRKLDIKSIPTEIVRATHADSAHEIRNGIIEFVRRYRGPTGNETDLFDGEIEIVMLASYSQVIPHNAG